MTSYVLTLNIVQAKQYSQKMRCMFSNSSEGCYAKNLKKNETGGAKRDLPNK